MNLFKRINNFYFWFGLAFVIWMLFLDGNDLLNQIQIQDTLKELEEEKDYYSKEIEALRNKQVQINNKEELEKIAREKYLMSKDDEDVFLVED